MSLVSSGYIISNKLFHASNISLGFIGVSWTKIVLIWKHKSKPNFIHTPYFLTNHNVKNSSTPTPQSYFNPPLNSTPLHNMKFSLPSTIKHFYMILVPHWLFKCTPTNFGCATHRPIVYEHDIMWRIMNSRKFLMMYTNNYWSIVHFNKYHGCEKLQGEGMKSNVISTRVFYV